jgi:hypothetical protein
MFELWRVLPFGVGKIVSNPLSKSPSRASMKASASQPPFYGLATGNIPKQMRVTHQNSLNYGRFGDDYG